MKPKGETFTQDVFLIADRSSHLQPSAAQATKNVLQFCFAVALSILWEKTGFIVTELLMQHLEIIA